MGSPNLTLAPPPGWTPPLLPPSQQPDVTQQTTPQAPQQTTPQATPQTTPQAAPQTTPASQDPEIAAGHAHQTWMAHILDTVGSILGGDQTIHITKSPDGTMSVTHDPSTTGEKWSRIAKAAIVGATQGLAHGQGPGGAAQAVAAGAKTGYAMPQQQLTQANQEAAAGNAQLIAQANHARLDQMIIAAQIDNKNKPIEYRQQAAVNSLNMAKTLSDMGADMVHHSDNMQDVSVYANSNPLAMQWHSGVNGDSLVPVPNADGSFNIYHIPPNVGNQMQAKDVTYTTQELDPHNNGKLIPTSHTILGGTKRNSEVALILKGAQDATNKNVATAWKASDDANKAQKLPTTGPAATIAGALDTDPVRAAKLTGAGQTIAQQDLAKAAAGRQPATGPGLLPGAGAAATQGLSGEAFLKASVDPSMHNQIRAIANGDLAMPPPGMRGANQGVRNAVMNYDPTYTDARYVTKQNFKTKGDATSVAQLSTAMAHADRALTSSAALGFSPSLGSGRTLSGAAAAYNEDAQFFSGEVGKLVMGGIVGEQEGQRLVSGISSPVQSIRDPALQEVLRLTSGKVGALLQKYNIGTQQDLPMNVFFNKPTQDLLNKYKVLETNQAAQGGGTLQPTANTPPPNPAATFTPKTAPAGQTRPGYNYGIGPKGEGWYRQ